MIESDMYTQNLHMICHPSPNVSSTIKFVVFKFFLQFWILPPHIKYKRFNIRKKYTTYLMIVIKEQMGERKRNEIRKTIQFSCTRKKKRKLSRLCDVSLKFETENRIFVFNECFSNDFQTSFPPVFEQSNSTLRGKEKKNQQQNRKHTYNWTHTYILRICYSRYAHQRNFYAPIQIGTRGLMTF